MEDSSTWLPSPLAWLPEVWLLMWGEEAAPAWSAPEAWRGESVWQGD